MTEGWKNMAADKPDYVNECGRCGRRFDGFEASINGVPYCHPAHLPLQEASCYMLAQWGRELEADADVEAGRMTRYADVEPFPADLDR